MTNYVKEFIQLNIEHIEDGDYKRAFENWYDTCAVTETADVLNIEDLWRTFNACGIPLETLSEKSRKDIIRTKMSNRIQTEDQIGLSTVVNSLHSRLGFKILALRELFAEAATECGYELSKNKLVCFKEFQE